MKITMSTSQNNKVLIIGAGPAGLALAQILRKAGTPFEIFERDETPLSRKQGWAFAIVEAVTELEKLILEDVPPLESCSVNAVTKESDSLAIVNANTGECIGTIGGVPKGTPGYVLRADREGFRKLVWTHIDVTIGKNFDHYVEHDDGVTVFFKDGSQARGGMVVGADGAHSHVRTQLIKTKDGPVLSRYIPILGDVVIPPEIYEPLRSDANAAILAGRHNFRYLIGQRSMAPDKSTAKFYYSVIYHSDDPEAESAWVTSAGQEALYQKAMEKMEGVHPALTRVIEYGGPAAIVIPPLKFTEYVSPESLPYGRVTLLGDAAHSMIPFKAAGANTAILDACDLGRLLMTESERGGVADYPNLLKKYESIMLPRGRRMVLASRAAGDDDSALGLAEGRVNTYETTHEKQRH